jgi:hypothetical protein
VTNEGGGGGIGLEDGGGIGEIVVEEEVHMEEVKMEEE